MSLKRVLAGLLLFISLTPMVFAQDSQVTHVVQPGENLYRIALRYGVSQDELARANNITDASRIFSGQTLVIPGLSTPDESDTVVNPLVAGTPVIHVVQPGESLTLIAQQYNTTVEQILQANNISNPNRILRGQELQIWTAQTVNEAVEDMLEAEAAEEDESLVAGVAPQTTITYTVQPGEHLSQIAKRYGITWTTLAEFNGITNPDRVFAGQTLVIPAVDENGINIIMPVENARNAPEPSITRGKQIIVDLSDSRIYAFEDAQLLRSVVVSTGLPATPTVQGDFTIWHRTPAQTMSGPGYYLPNVQWVQYFYQGYGIHGTYWHNNFGQPMSHGCVNLPNDEAEWFYNFGELGTAVRVQA
ncbi:MAG: hypothetical protein OHK0046_26750 [Anaerolineae bacterium]